MKYSREIINPPNITQIIFPSVFMFYIMKNKYNMKIGHLIIFTDFYETELLITGNYLFFCNKLLKIYAAG